jgi:ParB family transcriptional regulator, chromosome partitioning protein
MMINLIPIEKIKLDSTQPRKFIDQAKVKDMALSILSQGVINPIELDKDFRIVTGELRYRASKEAGIKEVPCKIIDISDNERFERQVVENVHHNTMSNWDTAKALEKLLSTSYHARSQGKDSGISQLARRLGKSESWVRGTLDLLEASDAFQKGLEKNEVSKRQFRNIKSKDKVLQKKLEKLVLKNPNVDSDVLGRIRRTITENPNKESEVLGIALNQRTEKLHDEIRKIANTSVEKASNFNKYLEDVEYHTDKLTKLLESPPESMKSEGGVLAFNSKLTLVKLNQLFQKLNKLFNQTTHELESHTKES